jgi:hypothetical protein
MNHRFPLLLLLLAALVPAVPRTARANAAASPPPSAEALMTPARQKELFDALDLSDPKLKAVSDAVGQNDYVAAEHAWADYLRQRTSVPWSFSFMHQPTENPLLGTEYRHPVRQPGYANAVAEDAVNGKVVGGLVNVPFTFPHNNINWFYNATNTVPPLDYQWQWQLCRMEFWTEMGQTYRATGDERYPAAWAQQLCSFVEECPVATKSSNFPYSAWESIDTGIRMLGAWPNAFFSFLESKSVTDADLAVYTVSCLDHGRFLRKFPTSGNWLAMEMNGLYTDGCVFPEFKEAKDWRAFAAKKLYEQETVQFLPDGSQYELTTGYHNVALDNFSGLARTAQLMGRLDELPAGYIAGLERAFNFDLYLMTPDRELPRFNDSWPVSVTAEMINAAQFFPDRADFQWVATKGAKGRPPATTSHYFDWAGFAAMRSGWDTAANYAAFRLGALGYGHQARG